MSLTYVGVEITVNFLGGQKKVCIVRDDAVYWKPSKNFLVYPCKGIPIEGSLHLESFFEKAEDKKSASEEFEFVTMCEHMNNIVSFILFLKKKKLIEIIKIEDIYA